MQENQRLLDNGRFYHRQGRLAEAADIYRQVARAEPGNGLAHHLLGLVHHQQGRNAEAMQALGESVRLEPGNPLFRTGLAEAHFVLKQPAEAAGELAEAKTLEPQTGPLLLRQAVLWVQLERPEDAYETCKRALALQPDFPDAEQVMGMLQRERGELTDALRHFAIARRAEPAPVDPATGYAMALLAAGDHAGLEALDEPADPRNRYREAVLKAIAAWQRNALPDCAAWLAAADRAAAARGGRSEDVYESYHKHMEALFAERQKSEAPYAGSPTASASAIGDAQVLAAAHLVLPIGGAPTRILPVFVPGCRAFHLVRRANNACRTAFEAALDRQPAGQLVIASVGDLDCRYTSGFMQDLRKDPSLDGEAIIERTVSLYADWIGWSAKRRKLRLVLQGPAASNAPLDVIDQKLRRRYLDLVALYNAKLAEAAGAAGAGYIDLFAATSDAALRGRPERFFDANHVRPLAIAAAVAAAGI